MRHQRMISCFIMLCLLLAGCTNSSAEVITDYPHPNIAMPGSAVSVELQFPEALESNVSASTGKLYELDTSYATAINQVEECFGIALETATKKETPGLDMYAGENYIVCIDPEAGYWTYERSIEREDTSTVFSGAQAMLSDEEAIEVAERFVQENQLWTGDFYNIVVTHTTKGGWTTEETIVEKTVWFYPEIDGTGVLGRFRISITMDLTGNITDVFKQVSDIVGTQNVPLISSAELKNCIANEEYSASYSENLTNATLASCDLFYYADANQVDGKTYLYPVYALSGEGTAETGETTFDVIVDALPHQ